MKQRNQAFILIATILICAIGFGYVFKQKMSYVAQVPEFSLPYTFKEWSGQDEYISTEALNLIQPDNHVMRTYFADNVSPVTVYIGHYNSLENSDKAHSPLVCFPGSGWEILSNEKVAVAVNGQPLSFSRLIAQKNDRRDLVLFGYRHDDITSASLLKIRSQQIKGKLFKQRSDSAFLRFSTQLKQKDVHDASKHLEKFLADFYPALDRFFTPDKME